MAIIDRFKISDEDHRKLLTIKRRGGSANSTFAPIMRLFVKMGLLLFDHDIQTLEQLEIALRALPSAEAQAFEDRIVKRLEPVIAVHVERILKQKPPAK